MNSTIFNSGMIVTIIIIIVVIIILFVFWGIRAHRNRVAAGKEDLVGKTAIAETSLEPKGVVRVEGEHWTAISDTGRIEPEEEVTVTKVEGLKLRVIKK